MEHRIPLERREQQETLQSHWLAPVSINSRGPFLFAVEASRSRTLISARTVESLGIDVDERKAITVSDKLVYPLVRVRSVAVGSAVLNDFEVVVWGRPVIPPEVMGKKDDLLYTLGTHPRSAVDSIMECRGVVGSDFLRHFKVSFDFASGVLVLEG